MIQFATIGGAYMCLFHIYSTMSMGAVLHSLYDFTPSPILAQAYCYSFYGILVLLIGNLMLALVLDLYTSVASDYESSGGEQETRRNISATFDKVGLKVKTSSSHQKSLQDRDLFLDDGGRSSARSVV